MKNTINPLFLAGTIMMLSCSFSFNAPSYAQEDEERPATAEQPTVPDRTDMVLSQMEAAGFEELSSGTEGGIQFHIGLTNAAARIIQNKDFEIPEPNFVFARMEKSVYDDVTDSLRYLQKLLPDTQIEDIYVFIDDFGDRRQTTSASAKVNSRVMAVDVRRWQKSLAQRKYSKTATSIVHELTHVLSYERDRNETKYHRELTAVLFEQMNYMRLYGVQQFLTSYVREHTTPIRDAELEGRAIARKTFTTNQPLRLLLYSFMYKINEDVYGVPEKYADNKAMAIEEFAKAYIKSAKRVTTVLIVRVRKSG